MCRFDDRILVNSVAQAERENWKESQILQIVLKLVLFTGDGTLRYWTTIRVHPTHKASASVSTDVVDHRGLRKVLEAEFADKTEVALFREHVAGSDRDSRGNLIAAKCEDTGPSDWITRLAVIGRATKRKALTCGYREGRVESGVVVDGRSAAQAEPTAEGKPICHDGRILEFNVAVYIDVVRGDRARSVGQERGSPAQIQTPPHQRRSNVEAYAGDTELRSHCNTGEGSRSSFRLIDTWGSLRGDRALSRRLE